MGNAHSDDKASRELVPPPRTMFKPTQADVTEPKRGLLGQGAGRSHHHRTEKATQVDAAGTHRTQWLKFMVQKRAVKVHVKLISHGLEDQDANATTVAVRRRGWEVLA